MISKVLEKMKCVEEEAGENVDVKLRQRKLKIKDEVGRHRRLLLSKRFRWTPEQIAEKQEKIKDLLEQLNSLERISNSAELRESRVR